MFSLTISGTDFGRQCRPICFSTIPIRKPITGPQHEAVLYYQTFHLAMQIYLTLSFHKLCSAQDTQQLEA